MPAAAIPTVDGMFSVWRADRCVQDASAHNYIRWIMRQILALASSHRGRFIWAAMLRTKIVGVLL